jgi:pentatricopeptide repeat protein
MVISLSFNKIVSTVAVVTFVVTTTVRPFRTNGYCNAFSVVEESMVRTRQSSSSTSVAIREAPTIRNFQPRSIAVSHMTSSDENDEKMATIAKDEYEAAQSLVTKTNPPFDRTVWKAYETTMEEIMTQRRVIKKCDDETISKCRAFLLSYEQHISLVPDIMEIVADDQYNQKEVLGSSLKQQAEHFQQRFHFKSAETEFINRCLVYMGDACAKIQSKKNRNNGEDRDADICNSIDPRLSIAIAWHKLKEMGYVIRENSMSTYMYILSNSGEGNSENDAFVDDALLEVVTCHDIMYKPNEKTVTIRLKSLIARGKIDEAEDMFSSSFDGGGRISSPSSKSAMEETKKRDTEGRLRTYMPLMEHYCMSGNLTSTLRLYGQMQDCTGVHWDVESYSLLLSSLTRFGYFFGDNDTDHDDENLYGPILFDTLVSNMANDILELTEKTSIEMTDAFQIGIKDNLGENLIVDDNHQGQALSSETVVVDRVEIPNGNGTCPITGVKLRLLALDELQRQHVHDTLLEMSQTTAEEFIASINARQQKSKKNNKNRKGKIRETIQDAQPKVESYGYQELLKFSKWLE